jgi:long-chain fatty acid transport protein
MGRLATILAILVTSALPLRARATPQDLFGFGARTQALGMTGVSYANDYEAAFANPAGLARARYRGIHIGLSAASFELEVDDVPFTQDSARGMSIGATLPIPFGDVLENRLVLGIGVYTPQQVLLRGSVRYPDVPQWPVLSRAQSIGIHAGLGIDLHGTPLEGFRLGIGVTAIANLIGELDVRLDETNSFTSRVETQLLASFAPIAGVTYDHEKWSFGVVYRHEVRSSMNLEVHTADLPVTLPVLTIGGLLQYTPAQVAGEASWLADPNVRLIANLTWRMWHFYPGPQSPTSASSLRPPDPSFSDTVSPRIAIEGTIRDRHFTIHLRGGYAMELSPSPPARMAAQRNADGSPVMSTFPLRFIDNDRHVLSAGFGLVYDMSNTARLRIDLFAQTHFLVDRTHEVPRTGSGPGDSTNWMRSSGFVLVGGWVTSLEF